jgi:dCMP deaminase
MDWDVYFSRMTLLVAEKSRDPSSKYGAVVVRGTHVISTGYNGIPAGMEYDPAYFARPDKYMYFVHAEQNAIYQAARDGVALNGGHMYVIRPPCAECVKAIIQSGIKQVSYLEHHKEAFPKDSPNISDWRMSLEAAGQMLEECKIEMHHVKLSA